MTGEPDAPAAPEPDWIARAADEFGWHWARIAWRRASARPGAWFDHAKAVGVVRQWPRWVYLTEDRFAGRPMRLLFWQEVIVRLIFGWKIPVEVAGGAEGETAVVHVRLFRQLRLWVPRKNGKTEFLAGLGLVVFVHEKLVGAQAFCFAKDENQGRVIFAKICAMIGYDPDAPKSREIFKKSIFLPETRATLELLSGEPLGKHGRSPSLVLGDEMHEWPSRELMDTLRQGTGIRLQPLEAYASTTGLRTNRTGVELWDESLGILDGAIDDPQTLVVMFAADPDADPFDEATWRAANPSLGHAVTLQFLQREAALAQGNPRKTAQFKCYHLNQWVDSDVAWIPLKKWDACAPDRSAWRSRLEAFRGRRVLGAFDVSSTQDITALIWRAEGEGGRVEIAARFWIPEDTLAARAEQDKRTPWREWVDMGAIETTPGDAVDQDVVKNAIYEGVDLYDVERIGFDKWNAAKLYGDMCKERGLDDLLIEIRQGIYSLGEPSKEFERLVFAGLFDHGGHPVLRWMARHCVIRFDENLNFMPAKKRSREKIDGIVAAVMAEALARQPEEAGSGIY